MLVREREWARLRVLQGRLRRLLGLERGREEARKDKKSSRVVPSLTRQAAASARLRGS